MNRGILLMRSLVFPHLRNKNYSTLPKEAIIYLDKQTIVCWHPEQHFPYECSKPLSEKKESKSVLRIGKKEIHDAFEAKTVEKIADELALLTQTTKHRWFPRSRDKKAKKTLRERKYL